jgi:hypothetical protein
MSLSVDAGPAVAWTAAGSGPAGAPGDIVVDALHDGDLFPWPAPLAARSEVRDAHARRRARGTSAFAAALARALGQAGFLRVHTARVALDLDQPPGVDLRGTARAVGAPLAPLLGPEARAAVAVRYREALEGLAEARSRARLTLSVVGGAGAGVSVLGSTDPEAPPTWVDPLVPRALLERTADAFLLHRLRAVASATEARLDARSLAVRSVCFDWMKHLQTVIGPRAEPLDPAGRRMWSSLLDVSGLSAETWAVRAHLHHGLEAPPMARDIYEEMRRRYQDLAAWVESRRPELLRRFFERPERRDHVVLAVGPELDPERARAVATELADVILERLGA